MNSTEPGSVRRCIGIAVVSMLLLAASAWTYDHDSADGTIETTDSLLVGSGRFAILEGVYPILRRDTTDSLDLATLRGKTVLLDFWASWCRPCIEEIPEMNAFAEEFGGREDFVFITVNQDALTGGGGAADVRSLVRRKGIEYVVLMDQEEPSLKKAFQIRAWPTRIMIAPNGEILERPRGRLTLAVAAEYLRRE